METKKSGRKRIIVSIVIVVLLVVIAGLVIMFLQHRMQSFVEVRYKTVGWFYDNGFLENKTYLILCITVTNKGYTEQVNCRPWAFSVTIAGITYEPWALGSIPFALYNGTTGTNEFNVSVLVNFAPYFHALPSVGLSNNASISGYVAFEIPNPNLEEKAFTLASSLTHGNYLPAEIKVIEEN
jgi:hypothetical protein